jgi:hypothetical protein
VRQSNKPGELLSGDESGCGHSVPFPYSGAWTRCFGRSLTGYSRTTPCGLDGTGIASRQVRLALVASL